jgi:hypothetical protein
MSDLGAMAREWVSVHVPRGANAVDPPDIAEALTALLRRVRDAALDEAAGECLGEKAACERHHRAQPRRLNHKVGMQIAAVCAYRVNRLKGDQ